MSLDFIVHTFSDTQDQNIVENARNLIATLSSHSNWVNVHAKSPPVRSAPRSFQYRSFNTEISVEENTKKSSESKPWGAPIGDGDDIFNLAELDEFQSTNLTYLADIPILRPTSPTQAGPCTEHVLDMNYLHGIVPQPHIHPSSPQDNSKPVKMVPYQKTHPIPIPPHSLPLPPPSPYSRSAWLIPIRGALPWKECTSAVMLDSSTLVPFRTDPLKPDHPIKWTHPSLHSFWTFLLSLKATHNVGALGLSFHAARPPAPTSQAASTLNPTSLGGGRQAITESNTTSGQPTSAGTAMQPPRARLVLSNVDYIKVYHEAQYAMYVRNALHIWSYAIQSASESTKPDKVRVLKGARLALVDERSKGILIS